MINFFKNNDAKIDYKVRVRLLFVDALRCERREI